MDTSAAGYELPPVVRRPDTMTELPLLPQQMRWLTIDERHPGSNTPLVQLVHRLRGHIDLDHWRAAVGAVVDRHEALRARFVRQGDTAYQYFAPPTGLDMEYVDLSVLPAAEREVRARELMDQRMRLRLNYATGPLVASTMLRLDTDDHVWALTIAHIVADGMSLVPVAADIMTAYNALAAGGQPDLPEPDIRYGDFLAWYAGQDPARYDDDLAYWKAQLAGVPDFDPPTDFPRPDRKGAPVDEVRSALHGDRYERAAVWAGEHRTSRHVALLVAVQAMLHRWTGQTDFCIGLPVAGTERAIPSFERVVGLFNRMVLLRCDLSGDPTYEELLMRTRDDMLDALEHQDLSFGQLVTSMGIPIQPNRAQVTQVLFLINEYQNSSELKLAGLAVEDFPLTIPGMPYDLMVCALPAEHGLTLRVFYDTALFTPDTVAGVIDEYDALLDFAMRHPDARLSAGVPVLDADREVLGVAGGA